MLDEILVEYKYQIWVNFWKIWSRFKVFMDTIGHLGVYRRFLSQFREVKNLSYEFEAKKIVWILSNSYGQVHLGEG